MPHTLVLLFGIMAIAWIGTLLLPRGSFERVGDEAGRMVVVPGSYTETDDRVTLPPWALLTAVPRALGAALALQTLLILAVAGIPYDRWLRFAAPLLLKLLALAAVAMVVAVRIGYR
jgi:uncharacterized ion transporter superfamily protein YfcC